MDMIVLFMHCIVALFICTEWQRYICVLYVGTSNVYRMAAYFTYTSH